jgi:ribosomal protein S28E/S33
VTRIFRRKIPFFSYFGGIKKMLLVGVSSSSFGAILSSPTSRRAQHTRNNNNNNNNNNSINHATMSSSKSARKSTLRGMGVVRGEKMMISPSSSSKTICAVNNALSSSFSTKQKKMRSSVKVNAMFNNNNDDSSSGGGDDEFKKIVNDIVYVDPVVGAKRFSNYFWASVVTAGASGFLITGASAYFKHNLVFFLDASDIQFFPQGLVMSFYGIAGLLLATYLWLTINWNVGAGYNEFNKEEGIFRVFRYGFPGKNRRVNLLTDLKDVTAVRVEISDGINPRRVVYVKCKGKGDIPLTRIGQPLTLAEVERQAAELAKFLQVPIEGL